MRRKESGSDHQGLVSGRPGLDEAHGRAVGTQAVEAATGQQGTDTLSVCTSHRA